jgi:hypothetical protein
MTKRRVRTGVMVGLCLLAGGCGTPAGEVSPSVAVASPPFVAEPTPTPTPTPTPQPGPPPAVPGADDGRWHPAPASSWQYQLSGRLDLSVDADVFDVDWEETTAGQVQRLHDTGRHVICYVNAGAFEEWRSDAGSYPEDVLGGPLDGWPGERWVDVRRTDVLLPLLAARMDVCRDKGFDAVEADNVDGYANDTGLDLDAADQLAFNTAVAGLAHDRGMSIGLKNDVEQAAELEPVFDFAVNEECLAYDECQAYAPFLRAGKAVFSVEYSDVTAAQCAHADRLGLVTIVKDLDLDAPLRRC